MPNKKPPTDHHPESLASLHQDMGEFQRALGRVERDIPHLNTRIDDLKAEVNRLHEKNEKQDTRLEEENKQLREEIKQQGKSHAEEIKQLRAENTQKDKRITSLENFRKNILLIVSGLSVLISTLIAYWQTIAKFLGWIFGIK